MLGLMQEAFDEDGAVAKRRLGFRGCTLEGVLQLLLLPNNSHATATTTKSSFNDDRKSVLVSEALDILKLLDWSRCSRDGGDISFLRQPSSRDFVTKGINCVWVGANENHA